jgi:hypothetical protein
MQLKFNFLEKEINYDPSGPYLCRGAFAGLDTFSLKFLVQHKKGTFFTEKLYKRKTFWFVFAEKLICDC